MATLYRGYYSLDTKWPTKSLHTVIMLSFFANIRSDETVLLNHNNDMVINRHAARVWACEWQKKW